MKKHTLPIAATSWATSGSKTPNRSGESSVQEFRFQDAVEEPAFQDDDVHPGVVNRLEQEAELHVLHQPSLHHLARVAESHTAVHYRGWASDSIRYCDGPTKVVLRVTMSSLIWRISTMSSKTINLSEPHGDVSLTATLQCTGNQS